MLKAFAKLIVFLHRRQIEDLLILALHFRFRSFYHVVIATDDIQRAGRIRAFLILGSHKLRKDNSIKAAGETSDK